MALPKFNHPMFDVVIPSTNKTSKYRPMLVREEKILLMAKTGEDKDDMLNAIKQVVTNCLVDTIDIDKLAVFDIEFLFLKIRAVSVNNIAKISFTDSEDKKDYPFEIDLSKVEVKFSEQNKTISVSDGFGISMRYPEASIYSDKEFFKSEPNVITDELIIRCIDKIYFHDDVYDFNASTREEKVEYINTIDINTYEKMREFLRNLPALHYEIKYTNSLGTERNIVLSSLTDFFTF